MLKGALQIVEELTLHVAKLQQVGREFASEHRVSEPGQLLHPHVPRGDAAILIEKNNTLREVVEQRLVKRSVDPPRRQRVSWEHDTLPGVVSSIGLEGCLGHK